MLKRWASAIWQYLTVPASFVSARASQSLQAEIEFHLQESVRDHVETGMSPDEARRTARSEFGSIEGTLRDCHMVGARDQAVCHRFHLLLTAGLLVTVGFLSAKVLTTSPEMLSAEDVADELVGDIVGRVTDDQSAPIENAHVLAVVKTWPPNGYRQQAYMTTTTEGGRFSIDDVYPVEDRYEVQIAAVADGRLLHSEYLINKSGGRLTPLAFELESTAPFELRVENSLGNPIEGVEAFPHRRIDAGEQDHLVYFQSADPIIRRSDADGLLQLPFFHPGDRATIYLRVPGSDWETREVVVPTHSRVLVLQADLRPASPPGV